MIKVFRRELDLYPKRDIKRSRPAQTLKRSFSFSQHETDPSSKNVFSGKDLHKS